MTEDLSNPCLYKFHMCFSYFRLTSVSRHLLGALLIYTAYHGLACALVYFRHFKLLFCLVHDILAAVNNWLVFLCLRTDFSCKGMLIVWFDLADLLSYLLFEDTIETYHNYTAYRYFLDCNITNFKSACFKYGFCLMSLSS